MIEQELQKQRDREADLQRLRGFRPVDDTFMRVLFRDNLPLAEYVLRVITGKKDLHLTKEETQKDLVRLMHDFLCSDPDDMYTEMLAD